jgi:hypothetical protein
VEPEEAERYVQTYRRSDGGTADDAARRRFESLPDKAKRALSEPYPISAAMVARYAEDGFIHLRGVLPPELVTVLGESIISHTMARNPMKGEAMDERTTYNKAFIQVGGVWRHGGLSELFSFSERLAGIAAQLMQTQGTLLHHDQALFKEPGGGYTPFHCDQQYVGCACIRVHPVAMRAPSWRFAGTLRKPCACCCTSQVLAAG